MKNKTNKEIIEELGIADRPLIAAKTGETIMLSELLAKALNQKEREVIEKIKKLLPKELGFDDYDKHIHIYVNENSGKCGICGLSWKKASDYTYYNSAIIQVKKVLSNLKSEGK